MGEPLPAPAGGPASAEAVAAWLQREHGDTSTLEALEPTVAAVNAVVRRWLDPGPDGTWRPDHVQGAVMLAARLWRRRKSVEGVMSQFTAEGPVYVSRTDPDVSMLLQLGAWAPPVVG